MANDKKLYKKAQFLAWEIYTGPIQIPGTTHVGDPPRARRTYLAVDYPGISLAGEPELAKRRTEVPGQCIDIEARLAATKRAVEKACEKASGEPDTLKVFLAPEFLYRGAAGAYIQDLLNGWDKPPFPGLPAPFNGAWGGLIGGLRELVSQEKYEDWVFVFGTAVGVAWKETPPSGKDKNKRYIVQNLSYVQRGGLNRGETDCYYAEKHLQSWMDFLQFNYEHPEVLSAFDTKHDSRADREILERLLLTDPEPGMPGGALFRFPEICRGDGTPIIFGLEICLDHASAKSSAHTGRLANAGQQVDIQLVPSCGMRLREESLALTRENVSYALNCDGYAGDGSDPVFGGHVQLWNQRKSGGKLTAHCISETPNSFAVGDQSGEADDPAASMHFAVGDADIDLSGRLAIPGFDAGRIPTAALWRGWFDAADASNLVDWPQGLGFIRRLPLVAL